MSTDKQDVKFKRYAIIGGSLGILTGFIFLAIIVLTAPSNVPINTYYTPSPNGHQPWLGCTSTLDTNNNDAYVYLPNGSIAELVQAPYIYYPNGTMALSVEGYDGSN